MKNINLNDDFQKFLTFKVDYFCTSNMNGYFTSFHGDWESLLGWNEGELTSRQWIEFVHPDDIESSIQKASLLSEGNSVVDFINRVLKKDGSFVYLNWRASLDLEKGLIYSEARDITDFMEQKEMLESIQKLTQVGSWKLDLTTNQVFWSDMTCKIHEVESGFSPRLDDAINFYIEEDRTKIKKAVESGIENHTPWDIELRIITLKGKKKWVRAVGYPIVVKNKVIRLEGAFQDIDSRKLNELKIKKDSELITALTRTQNQFIIMGDQNPEQFFNLFLNDLLKITSSRFGFIGEVLLKNNEPYLKTFAISNISWNEETKNFYKEGVDTGLEFYNLQTLFGFSIKNRVTVISNDPKNDVRGGGTPDGHPNLDSFMGIPLIVANEVVGLIGLANRLEGYSEQLADEIEPYLDTCALLVQTIRERKKMQIFSEKLKQNEQLLRMVLEGTQDGIWDWDIQSDHYFLSKRWHEMLGYELGDIETDGRSIGQLVHPSDLANLELAMDHHFSKKSNRYECEYRIKKSNGEYIWILSRGKVVRWSNDGKPMRIVGANTDITAKKEQEKLLLEAKKVAEEASHAKDRFLANMSHEIRTPMNGIVGYIELLDKTELNSKQKEYIQVIKLCGENLLGLINDILDLSKIESGSMQIHRSVFNIVQCVESVVTMFSARAQEKNIILETVYELEEKELPIDLDELKLKQILINLLGNALKFTELGKITIKVKMEKSNEVFKNLYFTIMDTGIGIPTEKQDEIFDSFTQADHSTTRKYGGTGLGLAICKRLVELLGGNITVSSRQGVGSEFSFFVKTQIASFGTKIDEKYELDTQVPKIDANLKILIVEDNEFNQQLFNQFFQDSGVNPEIAYNGIEALELCGKIEFDLILMDMQMPIMDGLTATQQIRKGKLNCDTPIIALTANAFKEDRDLCIEAGMDDFLAKPVTQKKLVDKILKWTSTATKKVAAS